MILDKLSQFASALALNTGAAGTYLVGDVIDLGAGPRPLYAIDDTYLVIQIGSTAVTSAGAATVQFQLASYTAAAIDTAGLSTIHFQTGAIPKATLVANYVVAVVELPRLPVYSRFLGILQVTGTAALTAGTFSAFIVRDPSLWVAVADGNQ